MRITRRGAGTLVIITLITAVPTAAFAGNDTGAEKSVSAAAVNAESVDAADSALMTRQQKLLDFVAAHDAEITASPQHVETVYDVASGAISLLWYGKRPTNGSLVQAAARDGIRLSYRSWPHSRQQIIEQIPEVIKEIRSNPAWSGFEVAGVVGLDPAAPGLVVRGEWESDEPITGGVSTSVLASAKGKADRTAELASTLSDTLERKGRIPVQVRTGFKPLNMVATRSNDFAPFNAAGYMYSPSTEEVCSSGFAVRFGGRNYTTTARHCNRQDYRARNGTKLYGTSVKTTNGGARVLSAAGSALNFDGAWNNSAGYTKTVIGVTNPGVNTYVCTSGGNSGVHCNIQVTYTIVGFEDGFGSTIITTEAVQRTSGAIAAAQGDSGGTVFTTSGTTKVYAAGMIQGSLGAQRTSCGSVHDTGVRCSATVNFSPQKGILSDLGATLVIG